MLENLIRDAKLAAMQAVGEVKDMVHDATTKLPDAVQTDYEKLDQQNIAQSGQAPVLEYMGNGWGNMASAMTANQIDMIADKQNFIANMIQNGLLGFDAIEEELRAMAVQSVPPQPAQLLSLATRIDSTQRQIFNGLQELRNLAIHIDKATDKLQNNNLNGWSQPNINNQWNK
ncbi:MAG: hypothetical protein RR448_03185 [Niameybacter sp.]|uniref:hypothetical protein n=1 Tax=Niameybacter sp. TaxID=2033640 RepID=UPI002FC6419C